jgi:hypothetical protein
MVAIQETLRSVPLLFPVADETIPLYTVRRVDNLEELAIFALSNAPEGQDDEKKGVKRKREEGDIEGGEGEDDDFDDGDKKGGKEKTVFCFVEGCGKGYTRLDSLRQHLGRFHPGFQVDSKFNMIAPDGRVLGQLPRKDRRNKSQRDGAYPCPVPGCGKFYSTEQVAKAHMKKIHPEVPVPKKIDATNNEGVPKVVNAVTTQINLIVASESSHEIKDEDSRASKLPRREAPQFPAPRLYPTYSFTTIPTMDYLAQLINPLNGIPQPPQPLYQVPVVSPVDWDKLKALMSPNGKHGINS